MRSMQNPMSLRSRCAHRLWQSALLVLGAGVLRIPTTSLRTGLGMTRKFFQPLSLRAGANTGYPARNPSTNLRLVPLPLGKGGKLSLPQLLTGSFAIASDAFPFPRKSAARDPAAAVMGPPQNRPPFPGGAGHAFCSRPTCTPCHLFTLHMIRPPLKGAGTAKP